MGISTDYLVQSEVAMLEVAGLGHNDFKFIDIVIESDHQHQTKNSLQITENYIHSVEIRLGDIPDEIELPILVLLHGYGSGGGMFF